MSSLHQLFELLDIPKYSDSERITLLPEIITEVDEIRKHINGHAQGTLDLDPAAWTDIWPRLQDDHIAMWSWYKFSSLAIKHLDHMEASARLAEHFETGKPVTDNLYEHIQ